MNLQAVQDAYNLHPKVQHIAEKLKPQTQTTLHLQGLVGSSHAFIAAGVFKQLNKPAIFIFNDKEEAAYFQNDLQNLIEKKEILFFPDSFKKPARLQELNSHNIQLRTEVLNRVVNSPTKNEIIVTYPEALFEKVVNTSALKKSTLLIRINEKLDIDFVTDVLVNYGFDRVDFVYEPGQFSIRGGIVDVFSFGNDLPYRFELFGSDVESIRLFDPVTQLSQRKISQVTIVPNIQTQFGLEEKTSLFDFISADTIVWAKDVRFISDKLKECWEFATDLLEQLQKLGLNKDEENTYLKNPPEQNFENSEAFLSDLKKFSIIEFGKQFYFRTEDEIKFDFAPQPSFNKNFNLLISTWKKEHEEKYQLLLFSDNQKQVERFEHIFHDLKADVPFVPIYISIHEGFIDRELKLACYTDHQVFERYHRYQLKQGFSSSKAISLKLLRELKPGDFVTHIDHGVGTYSGLEKIDVNGQVQEAVRIIYRDNDLLYVSINSLHKISKFVGKEGTPPRINKLGSDAWEALKRKTKTKVKDIAKDLIQLYAKRKASKGFAYSADNYMQNELEASFIYEDTPDQLKAINDVKRDMQNQTPMDRLVCGDVGFGKTEVAIRAAFKAVIDGKQVGVLVPTTILALQHYKTFSERLKEFPVTVDYINRFKSAKEQKETLQKLAEGKIDILIGTHAITSSKVKFKDLGLLIVDEEQKFGVTTKEKLRQFRANVDTLTLTATPIPRTMQFSLMGARDLSIINTPPPNRQPIETELMPFDPEQLKEIIDYEVYRGGQVFFVHNRVKDIAELTLKIKEICPDVDVGMAHGQMEGHQLEEVMLGFIERRYDVLMSTNIVESGLDIPNANTIIIHDAQNFGLSDLHQLRGRVGRSNRKAFCYLITPPLSTLTQEARKRLTTIEEFSELGGGFQVAMRDMDIRGAGDILGGEQSGFISEIGYDTYHKILDEAIRELKETDFKDLFKDEITREENFVRDCTIDTDVEMHIPDEYVSSVAERLILYRELDELGDEAAIEKYRQRLTDRFGPVPVQVEELFDGIRLRKLAKQLGFEKIVQRRGIVKCFFLENQDSAFYQTETFTRIIGYIQHHPNKCALKQTEKNLILTLQSVRSLSEAIQLLERIIAFESVAPE